MAGEASIQEQVTAALKTITDPTGRDVIEAQIVQGVRGEGHDLLVQCANPGFPEPIRQRLENEMRSKLQPIVGAGIGVIVRWEAATGGGGHQHAPGPATAPPQMPSPAKHVIAVGSGKGGVGKSTVAASLAYALVHLGKAVGIMDADVYGPSIPHMLGVSGQPAVNNSRYQPLQADGVKVMSMGLLIPPDQAVVWRGPMLHKAVRDFLFVVDWGPIDVLIVDLPPGTGDVVLSLSQNIPLTGGVIVCTPQDVALLDARKALNMLQTVKVPCLGIVENMSMFCCPNCGAEHAIFGKDGAKRWAEQAGVSFLGALPINLGMRIHGDEGRLRDNFADNSPVKAPLMDLARRLLQQVETQGAPVMPTLEIV